MKKIIAIAMLLILFAMLIVACDPCFWAFGSPSRQCIEYTTNATATYGAQQ